MLMEKGDKNTVRFYIPGKEIEMNRYNKPEYYYAEVICGNQVLEPSSKLLVQELKIDVFIILLIKQRLVVLIILVD